MIVRHKKYNKVANMSCFICNKSYTRLTQHLKMQHQISENCIEPKNISEFTLLLSFFPITKDMYNYRKDILNHINGQKKDLPRELYCKLEKLFMEYKSRKGMKPKLCIAQNKIKKSQSKKSKKPKLQDTQQNLSRNGHNQQNPVKEA